MRLPQELILDTLACVDYATLLTTALTNSVFTDLFRRHSSSLARRRKFRLTVYGQDRPAVVNLKPTGERRIRADVNSNFRES